MKRYAEKIKQRPSGKERLCGTEVAGKTTKGGKDMKDRIDYTKEQRRRALAGEGVHTNYAMGSRCSWDVIYGGSHQKKGETFPCLNRNVGEV